MFWTPAFLSCCEIILFVAGLLGIGILIGYFLMPGPGQQQTSVDEGGYPAPSASNPSATQVIDAESLAALQHQLQQANQAREQLESRLRGTAGTGG